MLTITIGTVVQTTCHDLKVFMGGRFILGLGSALASAAGPTYTVEMAHPAYRGAMAGLYNTFWYFGNIIAGWATYGSNKTMTDSWAWRTPTVVQAAIPTLVMCAGMVALLREMPWHANLKTVLFLPESPRWLIAHDRADEGLAFFAKYHGDGDVQSPIVQLEYQEVIEQMQLSRSENPWWDFSELVNTRAARYRLGMVIGMAFFGQW